MREGHQSAVELLPLVWGGTLMQEFVFLGGCPHCGDGIPAIVTMMVHDAHTPEMRYIGDVSDELKFELSCRPSARIFACKKISEEDRL